MYPTKFVVAQWVRSQAIALTITNTGGILSGRAFLLLAFGQCTNIVATALALKFTCSLFVATERAI